MSTRIASFLALVVALAGGLVGVLVSPAARAVEPVPTGGDDDTTPDDGNLVLRLKTVAPKASPWGELLNNVANRARKQTSAKATVKVFWGQKSEAALVRQCQTGKTDGIAVTVGALAAVVPELEAIELPFLFDDYAAADRALTAAAPVVSELLAPAGFVYVMRGENGFRHFASKKGVIASPTDLAGVPMRSQPSALHEAMWQALGAVPQKIQVADVPSSLDRDVVAGYDNTLLFARLSTWSEHIRYVTLSAHMYQGAVIVWCKPTFEKLPPEIQAALTKPDAKLEDSGLKLVRVFNDKLMPEQYKTKGIELVAWTADQRAAFVAKLAPITADFEAKTSPAGKRLLEVMRKAIAARR